MVARWSWVISWTKIRFSLGQIAILECATVWVWVWLHTLKFSPSDSNLRLLSMDFGLINLDFVINMHGAPSRVSKIRSYGVKIAKVWCNCEWVWVTVGEESGMASGVCLRLIRWCRSMSLWCDDDDSEKAPTSVTPTLQGRHKHSPPFLNSKGTSLSFWLLLWVHRWISS